MVFDAYDATGGTIKYTNQIRSGFNNIPVVGNRNNETPEGNYKIAIKLRNGPSVTTWIKITKAATDTIAPVITASDITLYVGETLDLKSGLKAVDDTDGDITDRVEITGADSIDTTKAGTYEVTYRVSDRAGNVTEKTVTVTLTVNQRPKVDAYFVNGDEAILDENGNKVYSHVGIGALGTINNYKEVKYDTSKGTLKLHVVNGSALDKIRIGKVGTTDFTAIEEFKDGVTDVEIPVGVTEYGNYYIQYFAKGATYVTQSSFIRVLDGTAPVITASNVNLHVGEALDLKSGLKAVDDIDGDITDRVEIIGADSIDTTKAGTYEVTYRVSDRAGNVTEKTVTVTLTVNQRPKVDAYFVNGDEAILDENGNKVYSHVGISALGTLNSYKEVNHDASKGILKLHVVNGSTLDKIRISKVGTTDFTTIEFKDEVTDIEIPVGVNNGVTEYGNYCIQYFAKGATYVTQMSFIRVLDRTAPVITASDITLYVGETLDIKSGLKAVDDTDGDITDRVEIIGADSIDTTKAGTYVSVK